MGCRQPYDRVLIVCEGSKTECYYFEALRDSLSLHPANIIISLSQGTDPLSIVNFSLEKLHDFDRVYCVFDKDAHSNYDEALRKVDSEKNEGVKFMLLHQFPVLNIGYYCILKKLVNLMWPVSLLKQN